MYSLIEYECQLNAVPRAELRQLHYDFVNALSHITFCLCYFGCATNLARVGPSYSHGSHHVMKPIERRQFLFSQALLRYAFAIYISAKYRNASRQTHIAPRGAGACGAVTTYAWACSYILEVVQFLLSYDCAFRTHHKADTYPRFVIVMLSLRSKIAHCLT